MKDENKLFEIIGRLYVEKLDEAESGKYWFDRYREWEQKNEAAPIRGIVQEEET